MLEHDVDLYTRPDGQFRKSSITFLQSTKADRFRQEHLTLKNAPENEIQHGPRAFLICAHRNEKVRLIDRK